MSTPLSVHKELPKRLPDSLGFSRYALHFDGVDDHILIGDAFRQDAITAIAWFEPDEFHGLVFGRNWGEGFRINIDSSSKMVYEVKTADDGKVFKFPAVSLNADQCYFAALTYKDGEPFKGYLNENVLFSDSTLSGTVDDSVGEEINIGRDTDNPDSAGSFVGKVDEVLVYDRYLSENEVRRNMLNYHNPIKNGLLGWWRFEEGSGLTTHDESGNGNDGTLEPSGDPPGWKDVKKWELRAEAGL